MQEQLYILAGPLLYLLYPVTRSNTSVYLWTSKRFSSMNLRCISARITAKRSWLSYTFRSLPSHETKRASRTLVMQHSSSQSLLPPVCPSNCVISHTFREYPKSMKLKEAITEGIERPASCIIDPKIQASCIACCLNRFAVGFSDGCVRVYDEATCQEYAQLTHGEAVRRVGLTRSGTLLTAAGRKKIKVWNLVTSTLLWTVTARNIFLDIGFKGAGTILMVTTRTGLMLLL